MKVGPTVMMKARVCPSCGQELDCTSEIDPDKPHPLVIATITICFRCNHLMAFTDEGFRELSDTEKKIAARDERVTAARRAIKATRH